MNLQPVAQILIKSEKTKKAGLLAQSGPKISNSAFTYSEIALSTLMLTPAPMVELSEIFFI